VYQKTASSQIKEEGYNLYGVKLKFLIELCKNCKDFNLDPVNLPLTPRLTFHTSPDININLMLLNSRRL
jgi:hypothetical protein